MQYGKFSVRLAFRHWKCCFGRTHRRNPPPQTGLSGQCELSQSGRSRGFAQVDLPGDGGGDKRAASLLEQFNAALGCANQHVHSIKYTI